MRITLEIRIQFFFFLLFHHLDWALERVVRLWCNLEGKWGQYSNFNERQTLKKRNMDCTQRFWILFNFQSLCLALSIYLYCLWLHWIRVWETHLFALLFCNLQASIFFFCANVDRVALWRRASYNGRRLLQTTKWKNVDNRNPLKLLKPPRLIRNQGLPTFIQEMIHNFARIELK